GMSLLHQVELSLFDMRLHDGALGDDPTAVLEAVRAEAAVVFPPKTHRFAHGFIHIFAGLYAGGYYSYLWSEGLAADGFRRFADSDRRDGEAGRAFRDEVLARGASRPAAVSFKAFLGRDPDATALMARRGLPA
ncbi:MAG: M3 family metallopeptidase, partial [Brevundimonas sp.]